MGNTKRGMCATPKSFQESIERGVRLSGGDNLWEQTKIQPMGNLREAIKHWGVAGSDGMRLVIGGLAQPVCSGLRSVCGEQPVELGHKPNVWHRAGDSSRHATHSGRFGRKCTNELYGSGPGHIPPLVPWDVGRWGTPCWTNTANRDQGKMALEDQELTDSPRTPICIRSNGEGT